MAAPAPVGGAGAAAAVPTVAELLQRASEAQAAAAAVVASRTAARGDAERLTAEAEAAQRAAVEAVTAAATAAGLTVAPAAVGGAGAAAPQQSIIGGALSWLHSIIGQARIYSGMACTRITAPPRRPTIEETLALAKSASIQNAPVFGCLPPTTPGYQDALIASRTAYATSIALLEDYIDYLTKYSDDRTRNRANPSFLQAEKKLGESIFIYIIAKYEKYIKRAPLEEILSDTRSGGSGVSRVGSGFVSKGKIVDIMPYEFADGLNTAIIGGINYNLGAEEVLAPGGGARENARPPIIVGSPDVRMSSYDDWKEWVSSPRYAALKAEYNRIIERRLGAAALVATSIRAAAPISQLFAQRMINAARGAPPSGGGAGAPLLALRNTRNTGTTGDLTGFDALLRAANIARGVVSPSTIGVGDKHGRVAYMGRNPEGAAPVPNPNATAPNSNTAASAPPAAKRPHGPEPNSNQEGGARRSRRHRKTRRRIHKHKSRKANKTHYRSRKTRRRQH